MVFITHYLINIHNQNDNDMETPEISLTWSGTFELTAKNNTKLVGDKIILPKSALEQLLAASVQSTSEFDPRKTYSADQSRASPWRNNFQQLPQPLTFLLINTKNGESVHAGIQEFSAQEDEIILSKFLLEALNISTSSSTHVQNDSNDELSHQIRANDTSGKEATRLTVHAKQLPKGQYLRLRPLEAGYDTNDWKSLLERYLRENFTTLTRNKTLTVRASRTEEFRFLIDKISPKGDGICIIDTDLEVDIEALDEEQARETLRKIIAKSRRNENTGGSSVGGNLDMWKSTTGKVLEGDYVDYTLPSWDHTQGIVIEANGLNIEIFASPFSTRQRARPREDEHVWGNFDGLESTRRITIEYSDANLDSADALYISLHSRGNGLNLNEYSLQVRPLPLVKSTEEPVSLNKSKSMHDPDDEQCLNCLLWLPKRTIILHENFCRRNNTTCPLCHNVFQQKSQEWQNHWHCEHDSASGNSVKSKEDHYQIFHTSRKCPNCSYMGSSLSDLASHRTTICPGKIILCQFCHLEVPQEGDPYNPSPEALVYELTAHELADGARTTQCHLCSRFIRLRDLSTHMKHHNLEKYKRKKPIICRNVNCSRTLDGVGANVQADQSKQPTQVSQNELALCHICFGPFYVNMYDPDGKALKRRVERRYLSQLISGCGKSWCRNQYCKTAQNLALTSKTSLPIVKSLIDRKNHENMYFCVDQENSNCRILAEELAKENIYAIEWCIAALESQGNLDSARTWLSNWAPEANKKGC